jgi:hypothetical protein
MTEETNPKKKPQRKRPLTDVEAKFLEARLKGMNLAESAKEAGLAEFKQNGYRLEQRISEKAPEIFDAAGVTVDRLAKKVNQLLDAKKTLYYTNVVLDSKEVPAFDVQSRAVDFGLRVHGVDAKNQLDVNVAVQHTHTLDLTNATEEELDALLRAVAPFRKGSDRRTSEAIPVEPTSLAVRK